MIFIFIVMRAKIFLNRKIDKRRIINQKRRKTWYCLRMENEFDAIVKEIRHKSSWYEICPFYADSMGNVSPSGVCIYLCDVTFFCKGQDFETSFKALDVLFNDKVLKSHVMEYLEGKRKAVRRANVFRALGADTLTSIELEGGRFIFIKFNDLKFKQLLSIAQAKQKYSKTVADRN